MHPAHKAGLAGMLLAAALTPGRSPAAGTAADVICGAPRIVAPGVISTGRSEVRLALSPDGSRMLWGAIGREGGTGGLDIWERRRTGDGAWLEPEPIPFNSPENDFDPAFAPDGSGVYFFSSRPGGLGGDDLYFAPYDRNTGNYGAAENLGKGINTPGNEWAPAVSPDGELLLFASDGRGGRGMQDLFIAQREGSGWGRVESLGAANGPDDDFDGTFLPGGDAIVFAVGDAQAERADLHVTERREGRFGAPRRLGAQVNAPATLNFGPSVSAAEPGVLFFSSHRAELTEGRLDIYRVALCPSSADRS